MAMLLLIVLPPAIGLLTAMVCQVALSRCTLRQTVYPSVLSGIALGAVVAMAATVWAHRPEVALPAALAANLLVYVCAAYAFFHFVNMSETARRVRLLRELDNAGGRLSQADLRRRYSAEEVLQRRLERLTAAGQILEADGRLTLARRDAVAADSILRLFKGLLRLPSEADGLLCADETNVAAAASLAPESHPERGSAGPM